MIEVNSARTGTCGPLKHSGHTSSVHQLAVHTVGGVVSQTEPLVMIVRDADRLIVDVEIAPIDRDQIRMGQAARLRFTAVNLRITPEVNGTLFRIANDLARETNSNASYFLARR